MWTYLTIWGSAHLGTIRTRTVLTVPGPLESPVFLLLFFPAKVLTGFIITHHSSLITHQTTVATAARLESVSLQQLAPSTLLPSSRCSCHSCRGLWNNDDSSMSHYLQQHFQQQWLD